MRTREEKIQRLGELIDGIDQVMFTTIAPDGSIISRPMVVQDFAFDGSLWFFAQRSSGKVDSIAHDIRINLAFMDPATSRFVSMTGYAEVLSDDFLMRKMWSPRFESWFTQGLSDPDLVLIRVKVAHAEYWDTPHDDVVDSFCLDMPPSTHAQIWPTGRICGKDPRNGSNLDNFKPAHLGADGPRLGQ